MPDYLNSGDNKEADKRVNGAITNRIHNEFNDIFCGISCLDGTYSFQVKEGSHLYQAPPQRDITKRRAEMATEAGNNCPITC